MSQYDHQKEDGNATAYKLDLSLHLPSLSKQTEGRFRHFRPNIGPFWRPMYLAAGPQVFVNIITHCLATFQARMGVEWGMGHKQEPGRGAAKAVSGCELWGLFST